MSAASVNPRAASLSLSCCLLSLALPSACIEGSAPEAKGRDATSAFMPESPAAPALDAPLGEVARLQVTRIRPSAQGYAERVSVMAEVLRGEGLPAYDELDADVKAAFEAAAAGPVSGSHHASLGGDTSATLRGDIPHIDVLLREGPRPKLGAVEPEGIGRDASLRLARRCADALATEGVVEPLRYGFEPVREYTRETHYGGESVVLKYGFRFFEHVSGVRVDDGGLEIEVDPHNERCVRLGLWLAETEVIGEVELPASPDQALAAATELAASVGPVIRVSGEVSYHLDGAGTEGIVEPRYIGDYVVEIPDSPIRRTGRFGVVLSETPPVASEL